MRRIRRAAAPPAGAAGAALRIRESLLLIYHPQNRSPLRIKGTGTVQGRIKGTGTVQGRNRARQGYRNQGGKSWPRRALKKDYHRQGRRSEERRLLLCARCAYTRTPNRTSHDVADAPFLVVEPPPRCNPGRAPTIQSRTAWRNRPTTTG